MNRKTPLGKAIKQLNKPRNQALNSILVAKIASGASGKHKSDKDKALPKKLTQQELAKIDKDEL